MNEHPVNKQPAITTDDQYFEQESGFSRFWYVLTTHTGKLIQVSLLFILFSLPVITLPLSITALNAVLQALFRKGHCFVFATFWKEFKQDIGMRILLFWLLLSIPIMVYILAQQISLVLAYVICALISVLLLVSFAYWFSEMAILKLSSTKCLKNAFLLSFIQAKNNLLIVFLHFSFTLFVIFLWPFNFPVILTILPGLFYALIIAIINPTLDQYIITGQTLENDEA